MYFDKALTYGISDIYTKFKLITESDASTDLLIFNMFIIYLFIISSIFIMSMMANRVLTTYNLYFDWLICIAIDLMSKCVKIYFIYTSRSQLNMYVNHYHTQYVIIDFILIFNYIIPLIYLPI